MVLMSTWEKRDRSYALYKLYSTILLCEVRLLFHFSDGSPLTKSKFVDKFRAVLHQVDIDGSLYSGHGFRIGAASTAAAKGVEDSLI